MFVPVEVILLRGCEFADAFSLSSSEIFAYIVIAAGEEVLGFQRTPPADFDGQNLIWCFPTRFTIPYEDWDQPNLLVLLRRRSSRGEDNLGYAKISFADIAQRASDISAPVWGSRFLLTCDVTMVDDAQNGGSLSLTFRWGEEAAAGGGITAAENLRRKIKPLSLLVAGPLVLRKLFVLVGQLCARVMAVMAELVPRLPAILLLGTLLLLLNRRQRRD